MKLQNKRVVITGGSEGIGLATARECARKCSRLVLLARNDRTLEQAAKWIQRYIPQGPQVLTLQCDVTDSERLSRTFRHILNTLGGIDVLINNAGTSIYGQAEQTPIEAIRQVMEVNYFGAVNCVSCVLPTMRDQKAGLIINIASVAALHGIPYLAGYGATKAALATYSQSLRAELCDTGIEVLLVYPGYTQTELFKKETVYGTAHRPSGPWEPPDKVARAIIKAVEKGQTEVVLSRDGKSLLRTKRFFPWSLKSGLARLARQLDNQDV